MSAETKVWLIIAAIAVGGIIVVVIPVIFFSLKSANKRFAQLWPTLAPAVGGASGTNFKSNTMTGSYEGRPVVARTVVEQGKRQRIGVALDAKSLGADVSQWTYSDAARSFELTMTVSSQGKDWSLRYGGDGFFGGGEQAWHVHCKDEGLKQRLADAGVASAMGDRGAGGTVKYKAGSGTLTYRTPIANQYAQPTPEEFKARLSLLSNFAELNRQVNVDR